MSVTLLLAGAFLAQSAATLPTPAPAQDKVDVAYEQLAAGQNREAVMRIEASRLDDAGDPAALINLGTAHARMGERAQAQAYYRAAIASSTRYDLQLADGSWMDSRRAARTAMDGMDRGAAFAAR